MKIFASRSKLSHAFAELRGIIEQERFRLEEFDLYVAENILSSLRQLEIICIEAAEPEGPAEPHSLSQIIMSKDANGVFQIFCMLLAENLSSHPLLVGINYEAISEIVVDFANSGHRVVDNLTLNSFNSLLADHIIKFFGFSDNCSLAMFVEIAVREATGQGGRLRNDEFDVELIITNAKNIVRSVVAVGRKTKSDKSMDDQNALHLRRFSPKASAR